jgi:hypothetical protein
MDNLEVLQGYFKHKNQCFIPSSLGKLKTRQRIKINRCNESSELFNKLIDKSKSNRLKATRISITPENLSYFVKLHSPKMSPNHKKFKFTIGIQTNQNIEKGACLSIQRYHNNIKNSLDVLQLPKINAKIYH